MSIDDKIDKKTACAQAEKLYELARKSRLPHAVIIECIDITEAYNVALKVAAIAFCTGSKSKPCQKCANCVKMNSLSHPDVRIISPKGNTKSIKIDDIRFVREDAYIISNEGSFKFYIITDADYLTVQAQNAFIKILEEPPKKVIFIILCESSLSLLETIRSRSQIFKINNNESTKEANLETKKLAEKIARANLSCDKCEVIKLVAPISNDRIFLKNLIDNITESLLKIYFCENNFNINPENFLKTIDELRYISDLADKNINFNLLTCYLCACL